MRHAVILGVAAATLAGCGRPAPTVRQQEAAQAAAVATKTGWDRVFASPIETVGSINQAGFGIGDYATAEANGGYRAEGHARMLSSSFAAKPNMGNAAVAGATPVAIDTITYTLAVTDPADAATARDRLAQLVGEFLGRMKIGGTAPLTDAIRAGRSASPDIAGAPVVVAAAPTSITVTFTRPAATAGSANTQG